MIPRLLLIAALAPSPWISLLAIRVTKLSDMLHRNDPIVKTTVPAWNTFVFPIISAILPKISEKAHMLIRYEVHTQSTRLVGTFSLEARVGSATFRMLLSSVIIKVIINTESSIIRSLGPFIEITALLFFCSIPMMFVFSGKWMSCLSFFHYATILIHKTKSVSLYFINVISLPIIYAEQDTVKTVVFSQLKYIMLIYSLNILPAVNGKV